ncbi:MAG: hypothetical protein QM757_07290 [Paludibaculum sp.]
MRFAQALTVRQFAACCWADFTYEQKTQVAPRTMMSSGAGGRSYYRHHLPEGQPDGDRQPARHHIIDKETMTDVDKKTTRS